jgi:hypothetical protein
VLVTLLFLFSICLMCFVKCLRNHGDVLSFCNKKGELIWGDDGMAQHIGFVTELSKGEFVSFLLAQFGFKIQRLLFTGSNTNIE